ncbi:unnamed protein product, partial [Mycena citricolor]
MQKVRLRILHQGPPLVLVPSYQRPLFENQKKGRPVSQCEKCRELRQSRRVHSKCNCPQGNSPLAVCCCLRPQPIPEIIPSLGTPQRIAGCSAVRTHSRTSNSGSEV